MPKYFQSSGVIQKGGHRIETVNRSSRYTDDGYGRDKDRKRRRGQADPQGVNRLRKESGLEESAGDADSYLNGGVSTSRELGRYPRLGGVTTTRYNGMR